MQPKSVFGQKFRQFFQENGIVKKWFAAQLGMSNSQLFLILEGKKLLPRKHWIKVVMMTKGQMSLADILADKLKGVEGLQVISTDDPCKCEVILKEKLPIT